MPRMDRRTRLILIGTAASIVAGFVLFTLLNFLGDKIAESRIPVLDEAIVAPYGLSERPFAPLDMQRLPTSVGDFTLTQAVSDGEIYNAVVGGYAGPEYSLSQCIITVSLQEMRPCMVTTRAQFLTGGYYANSAGVNVHLMAVRYATTAEIDETMRWMLNEARAVGAIGNFIIGVHDVDFYFSRTGSNFSFTYSHGNWMYVVSGASNPDVQAFVEAFEY
jgi:hypothetical protein